MKYIYKTKNYDLYIKQYLVLSLYLEVKAKQNKTKIKKPFCISMEHNVFFSQHQIQLPSPLVVLLNPKNQ